MKHILYFVLVFFCSILAFTSCEKSKVDENNLRIRKSVTVLSAQEKADFVNAILKLKSTPSPYDSKYNYYDQFVRWHYLAFFCQNGSGQMQNNTMYPAHMGSAFLPWHRVYLDLFEKALSDVSGKTITVPYWDWTDPASEKVVFADDFMGGTGDPAQGYAVTTGPFKKGAFEVKISDELDIDSIFINVDTDPNPVPYLTRNIGFSKGNKIYLPTEAEILNTLGITVYDSAPWDSSVDTVKSFRNSLEGWRGTAGNKCGDNDQMDVIDLPTRRSTQHNIVHVYVGGIFPGADGKFHLGSMTQNTSPNDPVFWIHHSNIDRMWSSWMQRHGQVYLPKSGGPMGTNLNDVMQPFSFRNDGINKPSAVLNAAALGFKYDVLK